MKVAMKRERQIFMHKHINETLMFHGFGSVFNKFNYDNLFNFKNISENLI